MHDTREHGARAVGSRSRARRPSGPRRPSPRRVDQIHHVLPVKSDDASERPSAPTTVLIPSHAMMTPTEAARRAPEASSFGSRP
jgi:hypothetical protein